MPEPNQDHEPHAGPRVSTMRLVIAGFCAVALFFLAVFLVLYVGPRLQLKTVQIDVLVEMTLYETPDCPIPSPPTEAASRVEPVMARAFAVHYGKDYEAFHVALPDGRVGYLCDDRDSLDVGEGWIPEEIW